ncbi:MAG: hypothetical protein M3487_08570 [Actinomycetota bacterium]|nr:hypothetical protein [Acidimicrobiia bacterium]MDQ3469802.1 hypothetical protein [Actinomycetota bacterium]
MNLLLLGPGTLANPLVAAVLAAGSLLSMFAIASWLIARFPDSLGLRIMAGVGATLVVVVLIATLVLTVVLLAAHSALHWPVRKYGLLLAASYTAGSGAPYWTGRQVLGRPTTA